MSGWSKDFAHSGTCSEKRPHGVNPFSDLTKPLPDSFFTKLKGRSWIREPSRERRLFTAIP